MRIPAVLRTAAAVLILLAAPAAFAQEPALPVVERFEWLGWPDATRSVSHAAVNDSGEVVLTGASDLLRTQAYVRVDADTWGTILNWQGAAADIDDLGLVVGWTTDSDSGPVHAYRWTDAGGLQTSAGREPAGTTYANATAVTPDHTVVGKVCIEAGGETVCHPYRWRDSFDVLYGTVENGDVVDAASDGTLLVRRYDVGADRNEIFLVAPDNSITPLPTVPHPYTDPRGMNDRGTIVGNAENATGSVDEAFAWDGERYVILPRPAGTASAEAEAVNRWGQIVGWGRDGGFTALVWENGTPHRLEDAAASFLAGGSLAQAWDVSDEGWVAGRGTNPATGGPDIFRLKLARPCPDPAGGAGMLVWNGPGGTFYDDPAGWEGGESPGPADVVRFDATAGGVVNFGADAVADAAVFHPGSGGSGLELGGWTWLLRGSGPCLASLTTLAAPGEAAIWQFRDGTLDLQGGAQLAHGAPSLLLVTRSTWNVTGGPLRVGHADTTEVAFGGSLVDVAGHATVGLRGGETGLLSLETSGLAAGTLVAGGSGRGELLLTGATLDAGAVRLGESAGGDGLLRTAAGAASAVNVASTVTVGEAGRGRLELRDALVVADGLTLAAAAGSRGDVLVGAGAELRPGVASVGAAGIGVLEIAEDGILAQAPEGLCVLGGGADGSGELRVHGAAAVARLGGTLVGSAGNGVVSVFDQAGVDVQGGLELGFEPGGSGLVEVAGAILQADVVVVGAEGGGTGLLVADETSIVGMDSLHVGPGGTVQGPVMAVGRSGAKRRAPDTPGIHTASLTLGDGAALDVGQAELGAGGTLGGAGVFPFDVVNGALVSPGAPDAAGTFTVDGAYTQTAAGRLHVDLFPDTGGPAKALGASDALHATGAVALAGTLSVAVAAGARPEAGDRLTIVSSGLGPGAVTGAFDVVVGPPGLEMTLEPGSAGLELVVVDATTAAFDLDLRAHREGADVVLRWRGGQGAAAFAVRQATGDGPWRSLATVPAGPDAPTEHAYRVRGVAAGTHRFAVDQLGADGRVRLTAERSLAVAPAAAVAVTPVRPNPFNPRARVAVTVARAQPVRVRVHDARGRVVATLHDGPLAAGAPRLFTLDGRRWASGVYFVRAEGRGFAVTRKAVLIR